MPTIVSTDGALANELSLDGEPVHFLWVVPLTTAECNLKLAKGFDAILDLFQLHRHPHIFDPSRVAGLISIQVLQLHQAALKSLHDRLGAILNV